MKKKIQNIIYFKPIPNCATKKDPSQNIAPPARTPLLDPEVVGSTYLKIMFFFLLFVTRKFELLTNDGVCDVPVECHYRSGKTTI